MSDKRTSDTSTFSRHPTGSFYFSNERVWPLAADPLTSRMAEKPVHSVVYIYRVY